MDETPQTTPDETQTEAETRPDLDASAADAARVIYDEVKTFKRIRKDLLIPEWRTNIEYRKGTCGADVSSDLRVPVPIDWSQTKAKVAALFSQVPEVVLEATNEDYDPAAPVVQKRLNSRLKKAGITAAMREVLPDIINASGVGVVRVGYEALTETRMVPAGDSVVMQTLGRWAGALGIQLPGQKLEPKEFVTDRRFIVERVSPGDFLAPDYFAGSDFEQSPWIGNSGRMPWPIAKKEFGLDDEDKAKYIGDTRDDNERMVATAGGEIGETQTGGEVVEYDQVFFKRFRYIEGETSFSTIQRVVWIKGKPEPVINEPWRGMRLDEELGTYVGACQYPIRVVTLDYISDQSIPPSTSSIGRPMVNEMIRSRRQIAEQRDFNKPLRWMNSDRMDPDIQVGLMAGDWQGFIPTQGDGSKIIGEVAKSNYKQEDWQMDAVIKGDLGDAWSQGPNQGGNYNTGRRSAEEARNVQSGYVTIKAQERATMVEFFLGIADVLLGLMCLYDDFTLPDLSQQDQQRLQFYDRTRINHQMAFSVRGDATVIMSAEEEYDRIERFLNLAGKSGWVAPPKILKRLASLSQLDPADVLQPPPEKKPEPPNISLRLNGAEDLGNPMVVAMLLQSEQLPGMKAIQAAKNLIVESMTLMPALPVAAPQPPGAANKENQSRHPMADDRPEWQSVDRINSRRDASQNKAGDQ